MTRPRVVEADGPITESSEQLARSSDIRSGRPFFRAEANEALLPQTVEHRGADILFYASDFPHGDHEFPQNIHEFWESELARSG